MQIVTDPLFWAFIGMFGLCIGVAMASGIRLGSNPLLGSAVIAVNDLARIVRVLPFCILPRFEIGVWNWIAGSIILAAGLFFGVPALSINWRTGPDGEPRLKTNGI
jgi:hypothetical protein